MKAKKVLIFVVCLLLLSGVMAFAEGAKVEEKEVTLLLFSHFVPAHDKEIQRIVDAWSASSGVKTRIDFISDVELESKFTSEASSGAGHDIVALRDFVSYIYEDILSDVSPFIKDLQSQSGKVLRLGVEASYVNKRWKSVPWYHQSFPMVYRKDYVEQVGYSVDKMNRLTVDEFLDMAKKLDKIGHPVGIPISSCPDSNACLAPFLWAFGGSMFEGTNKIVINSKETRDALRYIAELSTYMPKEVKGWDNAGNNLFILSGVGAVSANPPSIYAAAHKDKMAFANEIYHAPFPAGKAGSYRFSGVWSLGVPEFSKNKKESLDLIKFIMKRDNFIALVEASNGYDQPLYEGLQGHTIWSANPALSAYEPASENLFPIGWPGPNAFPTKASVRAQLLYILPTMFSKVVVGESTPEQAIAWAESELKRLVEEEPE